MVLLDLVYYYTYMPEDDSLEKLKKQLYSRNEVRTSYGEPRRTDDGDKEGPEDWSYTKEPPVFREPLEKKIKEATSTAINKHFATFVTLSVLVFVLTSLFVGYKLFFAGSLISPRNVEIVVDAPATARAGDKLVFKVAIENSNRVDLLDADLVVALPSNTLSADESGNEITEVKRSLGTIPSDGIHEEQIEVLLFGQEEEEVEIEFMLDYGTENSNARLSNKETHAVRISTAPVSLLVVPSVREVQSGNQFEVEVDVKSNTTTQLDNLLLEVQYPGGFNYVSSTPSPARGNDVWRIGELNSQQIKTITLRGYLEGQSNESRFFTFKVGQEGDSQHSIGRLFASAQEPVKITAPQIALSTTINKSPSQVVSAVAGEQITVAINWRNTLRDLLTNMVIEIEIDDQYIKPGSIKVSDGFYQSSTNTIRWDRTTLNNLSTIEPLDSGTISFSFAVADGNTLSNVSNPEIPFSITANANEPQGTSATRTLENRLERIVRIASDLVVTQNLSHTGGPNPPEAETESIYTVQWRAGNSGNEVRNTSVRAALPSYVTFVESSDERVRFSPLTNEVIWNIGGISENVGYSSNLQTSFEIRFTPSSTQAGDPALLVYEALIEGRDVFTGSTVRSQAASLNSPSILE
jgi:hypothetical protein